MTARFFDAPEHGMAYHVVRVQFPQGPLTGVLYGHDVFAPLIWLRKREAHATSRWILELDADPECRPWGEPRELAPIDDETGRADIESRGWSDDESDHDRELLIDRSVDAPFAWIPAGVYGRFTAFRHDPRLTPDGQVLPGTYVTTWEDAIRTMKSLDGQDIAERYALPGAIPRTHLFRIEISSPVLGRTGVAPRRFGQRGGGVEILLPFGVGYPSVQGFYTSDDGRNWSEHAYP
ncbi:MAG: hypothetical protein IT350_13605 [Deltaproteobacteria bacterium]|nr:hypothetical protein [Deltaproteobacteria bacterium]